VISWLTPTSGPVGTPVEIHGSHFGTSGTVTFNGVTAGIVQWGTTRIDTIVPDVGTTGPVPVVVTVGGQPSSSQPFTVEAPPQPPAEQLFYYHTDALGSVRMITDEHGNMVGNRYDYVPFGTPWPYDTDPEIRRFGQLERTLETGNATWLALDYAGARYYHSQTGRFTSPDDPGYIDPLNPQTWNLYAYVMNNPLRWVDPTGHQACETTYCIDVVGGGLDEQDRAILALIMGRLWLDRYWADVEARLEASRADWNQCLASGWGDGCNIQVSMAGMPSPAGTVAAGGSLLVATGQWHHAISRIVQRALEMHQNLRGVYTARDPRFVLQARDAAAHRGYQGWHRALDREVATWVTRNPDATQAQFEAHLRTLYQRTDLAQRFPLGFK
jgi:RHS repeat-associated protein